MKEENGKFLFSEGWVSHINTRLYRLRQKKSLQNMNNDENSNSPERYDNQIL